jgi:hypothetical protein
VTSGASRQGEWSWYPFGEGVLQTLRASKYKPSVSGAASGSCFIRAIRQGPRKGERIRMVEVFMRPGGHVLLRAYPLTGTAWPSRTVSRLGEAHALLDAGLLAASSRPMADQAAAVIDAIGAANAAIPPPVKSRRRKEETSITH